VFGIVGKVCPAGWLWAATAVTQRPWTAFRWSAWCCSRNGWFYC